MASHDGVSCWPARWRFRSHWIGFALQSYITPRVHQVLGEMYVQSARGSEGGHSHIEAPRVGEAMSDEAVALRIDANQKLSDILYAGAERKRDY